MRRNLHFLYAAALTLSLPCLGGEEEPPGLSPELRAWLEERDRKAEARTKALLEEQRNEFGATLARAKAGDRMLEAEVTQYLAQGGAPAWAAPVQAQGALRLIDVSFVGLGVAAWSTAEDATFRKLFVGDHDPRGRGFSAPNEELNLAGVVDPYFRADVAIVLSITAEGETAIELEEAFLTTLSLPGHLQVKAGTFFNSFGRLNRQHPHVWAFVDKPVVLGRLFGPDALRGPGAQVSWLAPLPFFAELVFAVHNAGGETAVSFLGEPGEEFAGRPLLESSVRSLKNLLYLVRVETSFDLTQALTLVPGVSVLFGPNATGDAMRTAIYGVDLYVKWKPPESDRGFPFASVQIEALFRDYEAAAFDGLPDETLHDWGFYAEFLYGFRRPWVAGVRLEHADGAGGPGGDFLRDRRQRASANVTYYFSEFSKLRFQVNVDWSDTLGKPVTSFFLQFEINFGAHGAHKF